MNSQVNLGDILEYDLESSEPTLSGNTQGKQLIRIFDISDKGISVEFRAGDHWLQGRPFNVSVIDRLFESRNMRVVTNAVEVFEETPDFKESSPSSEEMFLEKIKSSGVISTSELAKSFGKPVAAVNSTLQRMFKIGLLKFSKETDGLKWSLA